MTLDKSWQLDLDNLISIIYNIHVNGLDRWFNDYCSLWKIIASNFLTLWKYVFMSIKNIYKWDELTKLQIGRTEAVPRRMSHNFESAWFQIERDHRINNEIKSDLDKGATLGTLKAGHLIEVGGLIEVWYKLSRNGSQRDFIEYDCVLYLLSQQVFTIE